MAFDGDVQGPIQVSWVLELYGLVRKGLFLEAHALGNYLGSFPSFARGAWGSLKLKFHELHGKFISEEEDNRYFWEIN